MQRRPLLQTLTLTAATATLAGGLARERTEVPCPFTGQQAKVTGHTLAAHQRALVGQLARTFDALRQKHWA